MYGSVQAKRLQEFFLLMAVCNTVVVAKQPHRDRMNDNGVVESGVHIVTSSEVGPPPSHSSRADPQLTVDTFLLKVFFFCLALQVDCSVGEPEDSPSIGSASSSGLLVPPAVGGSPCSSAATPKRPKHLFTFPGSQSLSIFDRIL